MDMHSAFAGFPPQALDFLDNLTSHNERPWFETHKGDYQRYLLEPAVAFVAELGSKLEAISPGLHVDNRSDGRGVLMRIYRDTRFSKDKTPYKNHIDGLFWQGAKKTESPAFGFRLQSSGMDLVTGIFNFPPLMLAKYREAVDSESSGQELIDALEQVRRAGNYPIEGEHFKRVPAGYDPDHPRAELLRFDGLHAFSPVIPKSDVQTPLLVDICYDHFAKMAPLFHWLLKWALP